MAKKTLTLESIMDTAIDYIDGKDQDIAKIRAEREKAVQSKAKATADKEKSYKQNDFSGYADAKANEARYDAILEMIEMKFEEAKKEKYGDEITKEVEAFLLDKQGAALKACADKVVNCFDEAIRAYNEYMGEYHTIMEAAYTWYTQVNQFPDTNRWDELILQDEPIMKRLLDAIDEKSWYQEKGKARLVKR